MVSSATPVPEPSAEQALLSLLSCRPASDVKTNQYYVDRFRDQVEREARSEIDRLRAETAADHRTWKHDLGKLREALADVERLRSENDRLETQRRFLLEQVRRKDAASGEGNRALAEFLAAESPCDLPNACDPDTGEPCDRHEREDAHADGEHELCGDERDAQTGGAR